ncbi:MULTISPECIES: GNAT family N-acetyltransferase [unclassified Streptomyces]|uniref:GNAT family N-acetyltransferase n=1 Tax=unclassified Streptomyces TaxID=2593676 RepID=UPI001904269E|nr:GNAT family N-acetyltransferase [Streptomyces sp. HSG2]
MNVLFHPLDPNDRARLDAVYDLRVEASRVDTGHLPPPCPADFEGSVRVPPPATEVEEWVAHDERDTPVASLRLEFPREENLDTVTASVLVVHPASRRRGVGRRVLDFARDRAAAARRGRILTVADSTADGRPSTGPGFAEAAGAKRVMTLTHLRLLVGDAPPPAAVPAGLTARFWGSRVPEDLVAEAARLEATLSQDAPTGDLRQEPQPAAVERIRDFERMRLARGRRAHQCALLDTASGRLVAWTALSMTRAAPDNALQAVTVVDPSRRGLGLGRLVKSHNLARCLRTEPALAHVDTWNATGNEHMIRINRDFGFRPAGERWVWELDTAR